MARILIVGSGGREHALAYRFSRCDSVTKIYVAPGNPGIQTIAECINIASDDFIGLKDFGLEQGIDLTVVGPEVPLVAGIVDVFHEHGLAIFGPTANAAQLEGSKAFAKDFMKRYQIPTAQYQVFTDFSSSAAYLKTAAYPLVLKASGLAAGKGVIIAESYEHAYSELDLMMNHSRFGDSGHEVVVESFLTGIEFSLFALCHHETYVTLQVAQDHKRLLDGDLGPNTGGMGAYTPVDFLSDDDIAEVESTILRPTLKGMVDDGNPFTGVLFLGLMKTADGIEVIEYNVRFGDPETEVLMLALDSDLYQAIRLILNHQVPVLKWDPGFVVGVVLAAKGYPESYEKGFVLEHLDELDVPVFHMGTAKSGNECLAAGGRVLLVAAAGETFEQAIASVYANIDKIPADHLVFRRDIGKQMRKHP